MVRILTRKPTLNTFYIPSLGFYHPEKIKRIYHHLKKSLRYFTEDIASTAFTEDIYFYSIPISTRRIATVLRNVSRAPRVRIHSFFIHSDYFYSASLSPLLLRGSPDPAPILYRSFTPKQHRQLRVKDLPEVSTGFEPATIRTKGIESTNEPPRPTNYSIIIIVLFCKCVRGLHNFANDNSGLLILQDASIYTAHTFYSSLKTLLFSRARVGSASE